MSALQILQNGRQFGWYHCWHQSVLIRGEEVSERRQEESRGLFFGRTAQKGSVEWDDVVISGDRVSVLQNMMNKRYNALIEALANQLALKTQLPDDEEDMIK